MHILFLFPACFDMMIDSFRSHATDLNESIVLNENRITGQISVDDRWVTRVKIAVVEKIRGHPKNVFRDRELLEGLGFLRCASNVLK